MTELEAMQAFEEKRAVSYRPYKAFPEITFEYIEAVRRVRSGDKIKLYVELNERRRTDITKGANSLLVTLPENISLNGAYEIKKKAQRRLPQYHKFGKYKNVLLTDDQMKKLCEKVPNFDYWIERLSEYMKSSGKRYADHLATIENWVNRAEEKKKSAATSRKSKFNNYTDTNKPDYSNFSEQILKDMLKEE